jgi:hypothetical protein
MMSLQYWKKSQLVQILLIRNTTVPNQYTYFGAQYAANDFGDQNDLSKIRHCKENQSDFLLLVSVKNSK